ncbi:hypothetical protein EJB05_32933, partial [Eragrostis curvula]
MATLLQKFVGAEQWDGEDMVGRLGLLMHAAFLAVGFHPYGATPASGHLLKAASKAGSSRRLSRYYTVPELARREGADAAVLLVCARGGGDVALLAFLTTERHLGGVYRERLDLAAPSVFAPPLLLWRGVYGRERLPAAAQLLSRALRDAEPWASRVCWGLAGGVCWDLRVELCRRNGLRLTGLMSLPDDVKAEILKRLDDGKDLARVECTCTQLRELVVDRDAELWKPLYEEALMRRRRRTRGWLYHPWFLLDSSSSDDDEEEVVSWKRKYVQARPLPSWPRIRLRRRLFSFWDTDYHLGGLQDPPEEEEEEKVSTRAVGAGVPRRKVPRSEFKKKRHGSGAINSPSSRYRWKHRR